MTNEREHSVLVDPAKCIGCVACAKACPTQAIRVRGSLAVVKSELCTDCGACIAACPHEAMQARTSTPAELRKFAYTVAIPSLTLYGQFGREVHPTQVLHALTQIGFHEAYDMSWMCEMVAQATDALLSESRGQWPKLSVTCPAIVRLIQIRYPELLPHLVPIESPRELAAKLLRRRLVAERGLAPEEIGIFFITPCSAIMNSIIAPVGLEQSYFDGAFAINELYAQLVAAIRADGVAWHRDDQLSPGGLLWASAGGERGGMRNHNTMAVSGVHDVLYVFDHIEAGRFQSVDFIEAYMCPDGCVSGGLTLEGRYATQRNIEQVRRRIGKQSPVKEEKVRSLLREHFFDLEEEIRARAIRPVAQDLRQAIALKRERTELLGKLPRRDCGACGAPDCAALAEDVLRGEAAIDDCVFLKLARVEEILRARGAPDGPPREEGRP